jgi:hypothetical protein
MQDVIGDKDIGTLRSDLQTYLESKEYYTDHVDKRKHSPRADEQYYPKKMEALADYLLRYDENNDEYPIMTAYTERRNAQTEVLMNDDIDQMRDNGGIHWDTVKLHDNEITQSLISNYHLSEKHRRQLRNKNITEEDLIKYPELQEMFLAKEQLLSELGENLGEDDETALKNREEWFNDYHKTIEAEREHAYNMWRQGKSRLSAERIERLKVNPYKMGELMLNDAPKPITDLQELDEKFDEVLRFYGIRNNAYTQFGMAKRAANDLGYEMSIIRESLAGVIPSNPTRTFEVDVNQAVDELENNFDFAEWKHVRGLLTVQKDYSESLKINGRSSRFKYSTPLFQILEDKYREENGYIKTMIVDRFKELIRVVQLKDEERMVVEMITGISYQDEKGTNVREDIEGDIIKQLKDEFEIEKDRRQYKRMVDSIAKKISKQYSEYYE